MPTICKQFRLGVFFDGTGNNKANDRKHMSDRRGQQHLADDRKDSDITYANDPSNVSKLSDLYENGRTIKGDDLKRMQVSATVCEVQTQMIYVEGVGTNAGEDDYATGLALGVEGAMRINQTIIQVKKALREHGPDSFNCIIDVFGFSRGAAMARDFINTFNYKYKEDESLTHYKFGFVGIYDTVGSFGMPGNDIDYKPKDPSQHSEMNVDALAFESGVSREGSPSRRNFEENFEEYNFNLSARSAQKIVHLIAADEYRINFPLTNIQGSGGFEVSCIGVHSDIGGGYSPIFKDKSSFSPPEGRFFKDGSYWNISHLFSSNRGVDNPSGMSEKVAREQEKELGSGWKCEVKSITRSGITATRVVCVQERTITNDLQNVTLQMMYAHAVSASVPLKALSSISPPSDLQAYNQQANSSTHGASNYEPRKPVLDKYAHRSSYDPEERLHHRDFEGVVDRISNEMNYENDRPHRENYDNRASLAFT